MISQETTYEITDWPSLWESAQEFDFFLGLRAWKHSIYALISSTHYGYNQAYDLFVLLNHCLGDIKVFSSQFTTHWLEKVLWVGDIWTITKYALRSCCSVVCCPASPFRLEGCIPLVAPSQASLLALEWDFSCVSGRWPLAVSSPACLQENRIKVSVLNLRTTYF